VTQDREEAGAAHLEHGLREQWRSLVGAAQNVDDARAYVISRLGSSIRVAPSVDAALQGAVDSLWQAARHCEQAAAEIGTENENSG
jgi:hypothetical protein